MSPSASKGAILAVLAAALGFLILNFGADLPVEEVVKQGAFSTQPTAEPDDSLTDDATDPGIDEAVDLPEPTSIAAIARPPGDVTVLVANGSGVAGQARRLTDTLRNQGFAMRNPKDSVPLTASVIYFRPGFAAEAEAVQTSLATSTPVAPMPVPDPLVGDTVDLVPVEVLVLIGGDALSTS